MSLAEWMIPVMNGALVVGVGVVLPLALGAVGAAPRNTDSKFQQSGGLDERRALVHWGLAALCVVGALWLPAGALAASLVVPWLGLTTWRGLTALKERRWWLAMAAGFSGTAALALITSRLELTLFDIHEPIVKLTALHFTYAGAGTLSLADRVATLRPGTASRVTRWLVFLAPPLVATGFLTRLAFAQVGGAVVMTLGVWGVAALQFADVKAPGRARGLWLVSCLSPLVAMVLGVSWAAAQYWPSIPALTVPDMVPTHGALNAFGFVLCAHAAAALERLRFS